MFGARALPRKLHDPNFFGVFFYCNCNFWILLKKIWTSVHFQLCARAARASKLLTPPLLQNYRFQYDSDNFRGAQKCARATKFSDLDSA